MQLLLLHRSLGINQLYRGLVLKGRTRSTGYNAAVKMGPILLALYWGIEGGDENTDKETLEKYVH